MKKNQSFPRPHLDPEEQLCPAFDSCSIKKVLTPQREEMGIPIFDNCAEEHIQ